MYDLWRLLVMLMNVQEIYSKYGVKGCLLIILAVVILLAIIFVIASQMG